MLGSWAPLLEGEFKEPYLKELSKTIEGYSKNIFEGFEPKVKLPELFEVYKRTPLDKLKVIVIVDNLSFNKAFLYQIEEQLLGGLDVNLLAQDNFWWLHEQGIMFFPKHLSRGNNGDHKEWRVFTDNVLLKAVDNKRTLVVTGEESVVQLLQSMRPYVDTLNVPDLWVKIDEWCKNVYKQEIKWSPPLSI